MKKISPFTIRDGEDRGDQLISSSPLHCRHVRQAGFADNVKAIYFHAVSEEGLCVLRLLRDVSPIAVYSAEGQHMSGILIHMQQKGRLRQSVALCIHMHTPSTMHLTLSQFLHKSNASSIREVHGMFFLLLTDNI